LESWPESRFPHEEWKPEAQGAEKDVSSDVDAVENFGLSEEN
jgi:hypothetical protein